MGNVIGKLGAKQVQETNVHRRALSPGTSSPQTPPSAQSRTQISVPGQGAEQRQARHTSAMSVPSSRPRAAASSSAQKATPTYTIRSGRTFTSVDALPQDVKNAFLNLRDPVRRMGLTDSTVFYCATEKQWLNNGKLAGNPNCRTAIANHLAIRQRPEIMDILRHPDRYPPDLVELVARNKASQYKPVKVSADELPHPTLNVMVGPNAINSARAHGGNRMVVKMTLGDLRKAGGGQVFFDCSSILSGDQYSNTLSLIVTLPEGKSISVTDAATGR